MWWEIVIYIYLGCCALNIIFSILGMSFASKNRPLGWNDAFAFVIFAISGWFGTAFIVYMAIDFHREKIRNLKMQKQFEKCGGVL